MPRSLQLLSLIAFYSLISVPAFALVMKGKVYDRENQKPLSGVNVINTFTQIVYVTDSTGAFTLNVEEGHLIEFKKNGYQLARVRISGSNLPFYSIGLRKGAYEIPEINITGHNFQSDSIDNQETYKWASDHYTLDGLDVIAHPFDALSKRNRQICAFQKRFQYFEKQKFIDYVFNDDLIGKITGLKGDNLLDYKKAYRPEYEQIQAWNTYEFYDYIKQTGLAFKERNGIK